MGVHAALWACPYLSTTPVPLLSIQWKPESKKTWPRTCPGSGRKGSWARVTPRLRLRRTGVYQTFLWNPCTSLHCPQMAIAEHCPMLWRDPCVCLFQLEHFGDPVAGKQEEKLGCTITRVATGMFKEYVFAMSLCNFGINLKYIQRNWFSLLAKMLRYLGKRMLGNYLPKIIFQFLSLKTF